MNNQKQGPGCGCTAVALVLFLIGGPAILYIAPLTQPDSTKNMPDDRIQIQQIIQHWHGPQLPKLKALTGEVFTVSVEQ